MTQKVMETLVGFIVIGVVIAFFTFSYNNFFSYKTNKEYVLYSKFQNVEGVSKGSDVMLAGIKIGIIENMELDKNDYHAVVKIKIDSQVQLPKDSQVAIVSNGFLGNKFLSITPGSESDMLKNDGILKYTQSSISLEGLIGKLMYYFGSGGKKN